jgi:hypothetical protein
MIPNSVPTVDITGAALLTPPEGEPARRRRISFRSFGFFYGRSRPQPSTIAIGDSEDVSDPTKDAPPKATSKSKREARKVEKAALVLRSFLLGHSPSITSSSLTNTTSTKVPLKGKTAANGPAKPPSPEKLSKASNQLLSPDQANKVIAKLRTLPIPDGPELPGIEYAGEHVVSHSEGPIHAVCLDCTEEEADKYHFSRLVTGNERPLPDEPGEEAGITVNNDEPSVAHANLASLVLVLRNLHIITLVSSPDLGFGQPPSDPGLLAGSVPSAQAVSDGMMEVSGQLLALGFATSKAVYPDHKGVYPPKDRFSVLTCEYLYGKMLSSHILQIGGDWKYASHRLPSNTSGCVLILFKGGKSDVISECQIGPEYGPQLINGNFTVQQWCSRDPPIHVSIIYLLESLTDRINDRRYISQFLDFQWNAIKAQDKGKGVVCAATWVCPAALVPRPWDFVDPPPGKAIVLPKALPPTNGPTLVFPGRNNNLFTPNAQALPPVMITPATLPRGAKFEMLKT